MPEQNRTYVCLGAWLWGQSCLGFVVAAERADSRLLESQLSEAPPGKEAAGARTGEVVVLGPISGLAAPDLCPKGSWWQCHSG